MCTDLGCQASASFTDEKGKQDGRVESAVVWVCGGKLALSSERRLNNSERKIMQKESVPFNFPWNWKYVAFLLFFFLLNDTLIFNVYWRLSTYWHLVAQSLRGGAAGRTNG